MLDMLNEMLFLKGKKKKNSKKKKKKINKKECIQSVLNKKKMFDIFPFLKNNRSFKCMPYIIVTRNGSLYKSCIFLPPLQI